MYGNILVPIDGSETAKRGLNEAVSLAKSLGSRIRVIHVINQAELLSPYTVGSTYPLILRQVHDYGASEYVVRQSPVPVLLVRARESGR